MVRKSVWAKVAEEQRQQARNAGCQCTEDMYAASTGVKHGRCRRQVAFFHIGTEEFLCTTCNKHYDPTNEEGKTWCCPIEDPYYLYGCNVAKFANVNGKTIVDHSGCQHG